MNDKKMSLSEFIQNNYEALYNVVGAYTPLDFVNYEEIEKEIIENERIYKWALREGVEKEELSKKIEYTSKEIQSELEIHVSRDEIEIYIGGWFLMSTSRENISPEACYELISS